jgi:hypothetical protein
MSTDPQADAIAYAVAAAGSEEQRTAFARFTAHWRGQDGVINVGAMERWPTERSAAAAAPKPQPAQAAPVTSQPGRASDEAFAKMSAAERLDHVRQFDQSKMPAWRDPRQG